MLSRSAAVALAWAVLGGLAALPGVAWGDPSPLPPLISCDRADERIVLTESARLDPHCTYSRGVEIRSSGVSLDCQGALISGVAGTGVKRGIYIGGPEDIPLTDITVRGCTVENFLNNLRIEREGFKALPQGEEYQTLFSNIVVEDSELRGSYGSGVFVNAFVTGVTLRGLDIHHSEGVGIYLEAGSRDNIVEDCYLHENGFDASTVEPTPIHIGPVTVNVHIEGREGLAIDGARTSIIRNNVFEANAAGGINLYKNCGEYVHTEPDAHWERYYGADDNVIEGNLFIGEKHGVWVGSRMAQNLLFMDCSDPWYARGPLWRIYLDYAQGNQILNNVFEDVGYAIRIEDDGTVVEGNLMTSSDPDAVAVVMGTVFRTLELGAPVADTVIRGNEANMRSEGFPYTWIHGHENTVFEENQTSGSVAVLAEGKQPPMTYHVFVDHLSFER